MSPSMRHCGAMKVKQMDKIEQSELICFLDEIAIPAAMENNACKCFSCETDKLSSVLIEDNLDELQDLWRKTLTQIIPTLQSTLYPLQALRYLQSSAVARGVSW
ncbi:hypothetical protein AB6A40_010366 [Gnathostoma spinigerum]|uniref:Uncharacterized protein n=1 Tax=Gnathostoma spinigerum TaxID=75299 RepID=A0ABD6F2B7_9BILA